MIYTVTLNPALDYYLYVDKVEMDTVARAQKVAMHAGGKGVNVSKVLSVMGIDNLALGFLGGLIGQGYQKLMGDLRADFVSVEGDTRINVKIMDERSELGVNADGLNAGEKDIQALLSKVQKAVSGDLVCLCGSVPSSVDKGVYGRVMETMKSKGVRFVVDATGDLLIKSLPHKPFLIKPNFEELCEIFGAKIPDTEQGIVEYARKLLQMGAQNVLVSRGGDGAILVTQEGVYTRGAIKGKVVSTVGAGDSMVAGFVASVARGKDLQEALKQAIACGSATAFCEGIATKAEIDKIYGQL
ncbi:MAG: 1-phosphofructokinase [Firmicutes bacterium]|nr:1-phosphofructokinase [Bacillota bacterium]